MVLVGTRRQPVDVAIAAGSADIGVVTSEQDPVGAVIDATDGEGAAVTFETVGGQTQLIQQAGEDDAPRGRGVGAGAVHEGPDGRPGGCDGEGDFDPVVEQFFDF